MVDQQCPICEYDLTESFGRCAICFHGTERGLLVYDQTAGGGYVHRQCLRFFGCDTLAQYERSYRNL